MRWSHTLALAGLVTTLLTAAPALADYRSSFRDGVRAFEREQYEEAATALRRALADRPVADPTKISAGPRRLPYIPNTVLAISLAKLGQCVQAVPYFQASNNQGVAAREAPAFYRQMRAAQSECAANAANELIQATETALAEAREIARGVSTVLDRPETVDLLSDRSELESRARRASEMVDNAASLLQAGRRSNWFQALGDARKTAEAARETLIALRADIRSGLQAAIEPLLQALEKNLENAESERVKARRDLDAITNEDAAQPIQDRYTTVVADLTAITSRLDQARQLRDPSQLVELSTQAGAAAAAFSEVAREAGTLIARSTSDLRPAAVVERPAPGPATPSTDPAPGAPVDPPPSARTGSPATVESDTPAAASARSSEGAPEQTVEATGTTPPSETAAIVLDPETGLPEALVAGAMDYFSGEYQTALERLQGVRSTDARITAQAALLRAAASYALYRLSGERDDQLLETTERELSEARRVQPDLAVDESYFPPPFIELFNARPP